MIFNDTTNRQGIIQAQEDTTGLGATGITGNTTLFQQFTRWTNQWNKIEAAYAILAFDGHDIDDLNYTTLPSGYFDGNTTREYDFSSVYKMLKIKLVNISYDGTNYVPANVLDDAQRLDIAVKDPNVDSKFSAQSPKYDLFANGIRIYPKFTQAQVDAGAKVYAEFFRTPRDFATTGTDDWEPCFDSPFHHLSVLGPAFEYAKLYKPDLVASLRIDIYGGGTVKGVLKELKDWYSSKQIGVRGMRPAKHDNK